MEMMFKYGDLVQALGTGQVFRIVGTPDDNALEATGQSAYGYKAAGETTTLWRYRGEVEDGRFTKVGHARSNSEYDDDYEYSVGHRKFKKSDVVRHIKSGGVYVVTNQPDFNRLAADNLPAYGYRSVMNNGVRWWRCQSEMEDGRFEPASVT